MLQIFLSCLSPVKDKSIGDKYVLAIKRTSFGPINHTTADES